MIHLREAPPNVQADDVAEASMHHYFAYRARLAQNDLRQLLRQGRTSLFIGLGFLGLCLGAGRMLASLWNSPLSAVLQEGAVIGGWVAMWRPLEILLYDWWPVRRSRLIYEKLASAPVIVEIESAPGHGRDLA